MKRMDKIELWESIVKSDYSAEKSIEKNKKYFIDNAVESKYIILNGKKFKSEIISEVTISIVNGIVGTARNGRKIGIHYNENEILCDEDWNYPTITDLDSGMFVDTDNFEFYLRLSKDALKKFDGIKERFVNELKELI
jgi:hypothetical protein